MDKVEFYYENYTHDPNLLGVNFMCAGAKKIEDFPEDKGSVVGKKINFVTRSKDMNIVEDRSGTPLKGCIHYDHSICKLGDTFCPVAGVVDMDSFGRRLQKVKALIQTTYATG